MAGPAGGKASTIAGMSAAMSHHETGWDPEDDDPWWRASHPVIDEVRPDLLNSSTTALQLPAQNPVA